MRSSKIKLIRVGSTVNVLLSHPNMGIDVGIGRYQIRQVMVTCQCNCRRSEATDDGVHDIPNT